MVAVISTGCSLYGALAYNEKKVEQGDAISLGGVNSMARAERQDLREKARSLQNIADRNLRTKRNSVHVALSFAQSDRLNEQQLRGIAQDYLRGIGFGDQPAYIYRHRDTDHDHIHIVTTNITREGKRINDSFIGAIKSEETRKQIEEKYGLVRAEEQGEKQNKAKRLSALNAPQGEDKTELRAYARHTIRDTLQVYRPGSVGELNALLRERGLKVREEKGQTAQGEEWRGYSVVRIDNRSGEETSAAIKASRVFGKGWGSSLDRTLSRNTVDADKMVSQIRDRVREAFAEERASVADVRDALEKRNIRTVHHHNAEGRRYGVHYVDETSGHIFKASQIGRGYSAGEWNRREQTNTLSLEDYKRLAADFKTYIADRQREIPYRSAVINQLRGDELQFAMAQLGHRSEDIRPYLDEIIAAEKKDYERAVKQDHRQLKALSWGLAQIRPEYRAAVMESLGMERQGGEIVLRDNREVRVLAPEQLKEEGKGVKLKIGELSAEERRMLVGVGRYRGIGGIPLDVNLTTVDWKYWEGKFLPGTAEKLGRQLHNNYVKRELILLNKNSEGEGRGQPLIRLASKGILIEPTPTGYRAHMVGRESYSLQLSGELASGIYREDYRTEHYQKMKSLLEETVAKQALDTLQQAKITQLRSTPGQHRKVPKSLSYELRGYLMSQGGTAKRSGLYTILQAMDEDENLSWDERKQNRTLRQ